MTWQDDRNRSIRSLERDQAVLFCASCCQRMLPSYAKFEADEHSGTHHDLEGALDRVWQHVAGGPGVGGAEAHELIAKAERAAPFTEDHRSLFTSAALDAANAIAETLMLVADGDDEHAVGVATLATDTIDMFIQVVDQLSAMGEEMESHIRSHPLMLREARKQASDLALIEAEWPLNESLIINLRRSARYDLLA